MISSIRLLAYLPSGSGGAFVASEKKVNIYLFTPTNQLE